MSGHTARFAIAAVAASAVVLLVGRWLASPAGDSGVAAGVVLAVTTQLFASWIFADMLLPGQRFLAYGLGMLARFAAVAATALLVVPQSGLPAVPTLLALVSVFFVLAVLEPVFMPSSKETIAR